MKIYEKPELSFVNLRAKETIADTCWGLDENHTHQYTRYYDVEGPGYVSFNVKGSGKGSCGAPDAYNVKYYPHKGAKPENGSKYEPWLEEVLASTPGGNKGQPYAGLDTFFPTDPDQGWS